ncbi:MAG: quinone oxidoreductase [Nanoarchaeota archaeon]|nr:quinone oxidoreductase [Nanoarchaeota archaeon]
MKAIRVNKFGGSDVLSYEDMSMPEPKENEARVKIEVAGVNYIDIYQRTGLYPNEVPFTPGMEAAGVVDAVGGNVSEVSKGDRIAYAMNIGSYAEYVIVPAWKLVKIPDDIDIKTACASMLQGMTAHYLTHSTFKIKKNNTILLHAAAGGVGLLLTQIAKKLGARVIGTVSTEEKAKLAKEAGADEIILYTKEDFEVEVKKLTNNNGVDVVYDSVGKTTFLKSLNCLKPRGLLVSFGQSSGAIPEFNTRILSEKGSLFLTRPTLANYATNNEDIMQRTNDLFQWINSGELKIRIHKTFPLSEAKEAHKELESRKTMGKLLLIP